MSTDIKSLFSEINQHLLYNPKPSEYLNQLYYHPLFKENPYNMLHCLKDTNQSPKHHPEGNVWNHTLLVVDEAANVKSKSKNPRVFVWAALLHDIGKPATTKNHKGKITAYDHDKVGAKLTEEFLSQLTDEKDFIAAVTQLVRWHMQILFVVKDLPFGDIHTMKQSSDINEVALLGLCDRLGRTNVNKSAEENNIRLFLQKCSKVS